MTRYRWLAAWMILMVVWVPPLHALNTEDASIHTDRLWQRAALEQTALEQSGSVLHDAPLQRYLQILVARLWEQVHTHLKTPVVEVVMDSRMEAYTYPNGYIVLTSGILDPIENEDQLAMILAHEMIHYARQHTAEFYDHFQIPVHETGLRPTDHRQAFYSNQLEQKIDAAEKQADEEGLSIIKGAGYCQAEVLTLLSKLMGRLKNDATSEALENMASRKRFMTTLIDQEPESPSCTASTSSCDEYFLDAIAPVLMANAQVALRRGEWNQADQSISRYLVLKPTDARAYYVQAEIMRRRGDGDHKSRCIGLYEAALKMDPGFPLVHRALGELHFKAGQYQQAKPYFEAFLSLAPQDEAREYIKGYLRQCQN